MIKQATSEYLLLIIPMSKIYNFQYNQNLNIDFRKIVKGKTVIEKILNKFYNQTAVNTQKKTNELD